MRGTALRAELRGPEGRPLSAGERRALVALANNGDLKQSANSLGITHSTIKNQVSKAYAKLGVGTCIEAFRELGWLQVPE